MELKTFRVTGWIDGERKTPLGYGRQRVDVRDRFTVQAASADDVHRQYHGRYDRLEVEPL